MHIIAWFAINMPHHHFYKDTGKRSMLLYVVKYWLEGEALRPAPESRQSHPNVHKEHKNSINSSGDEGHPKTQTIRADDCAMVSMNS